LGKRIKLFNAFDYRGTNQPDLPGTRVTNGML
jgi:hypothetical protein